MTTTGAELVGKLEDARRELKGAVAVMVEKDDYWQDVADTERAVEVTLHALVHLPDAAQAVADFAMVVGHRAMPGG